MKNGSKLRLKITSPKSDNNQILNLRLDLEQFDQNSNRSRETQPIQAQIESDSNLDREFRPQTQT